MSYSIFYNLIINAPTKDVFDAVSLPIHLNNWWTLKSSGIPVLNSEYNLNFTDDYNWYCKISHIVINKSIHFSMTKSDSDWNPTTFGFHLEQQDKGTMVKFSHENWQEANHHFKHSLFC